MARRTRETEVPDDKRPHSHERFHLPVYFSLRCGSVQVLPPGTASSTYCCTRHPNTVSEALKHTNPASLSTFHWQDGLFYEYIYFLLIFNMVPTAFAVFKFVLSNVPAVCSGEGSAGRSPFAFCKLCCPGGSPGFAGSKRSRSWSPGDGGVGICCVEPTESRSAHRGVTPAVEPCPCTHLCGTF